MGMGSVRVGDVGAPEDGFIRYYAGEGNGEVSVIGCGASWRTSKVEGNRLAAFFESALCFDVAVEWSSLLYLLCRAFDRLIGRG